MEPNLDIKLKYRMIFYRSLVSVVTLIISAHYALGNYHMVPWAFGIFIMLCLLTTNRILKQNYDIVSKVFLGFIFLGLTGIVFKTDFINSPTLIWIIGLAFMTPFIYSKRVAKLSLAYAILVITTSFILQKMHLPIQQMPIKNLEAFRMVAYGFNFSILSYLILSFIKNYEDSLKQTNEQIIFNQNLYDVFDSAEDYIGIASPSKGVVYHNKAFVEVTGKDPRTSHFEIKDFHPPHILEGVLKEGFKKVKEVGTWTGETVILGKNDEHIPVLQTLIGHFDKNNEIIRVSTIMKNITGLRNLIEEKEIAEQQAMFANKAKSEFLANMSHEIRTPLHGIIGSLEVISRNNLDDEQLEILSNMQISSTYLLGLLNDILDFSKLEANKISVYKEFFDIKKVVEEVIRIQTNVANEKDIKLELSFNGEFKTINSDVTKFKQVLNNLLSNAIKFSSQKMTVKVEIKSHSKGLVLEIIDSGIGMDEESIKRIFQPFSQANSKVARDYGGTGLGLIICKEMLALIDGEIFVKSTKGKGTCFTVKLIGEMRKQSLPLSKLSQEISISDCSNLDVVVVDDNRINLKIANSFLKQFNVENIMLFNDPITAIEYLKSKKFDLLFLDLKMPRYDGYQLFEDLKRYSNENNYELGKTYAFSANAFYEDKQKCLESGFDGHLAKPLDKKELARILNHVSQMKKNAA